MPVFVHLSSGLQDTIVANADVLHVIVTHSPDRIPPISVLATVFRAVDANFKGALCDPFLAKHQCGGRRLATHTMHTSCSCHGRRN